MWRRLFAVSFLTISAALGSAYAQERGEFFMAELPVVFDLQRPALKTSMSISVPMRWIDLPLSEFSETHRNSSDQVLTRFLNAIRSGVGPLAPMIVQDDHFRISDEEQFRGSLERFYFHSGQEPQVMGAIPAFETRPPALAGAQVHNDNLLAHLSNVEELAAGSPIQAKITALFEKIEAQGVASGFAPRDRAKITQWLEEMPPERRAKESEGLLAQLKTFDKLLDLAPIYVLIPKDQVHPAFFLIEGEEEALRITGFYSQSPFTELIGELRKHEQRQ